MNASARTHPDPVSYPHLLNPIRYDLTIDLTVPPGTSSNASTPSNKKMDDKPTTPIAKPATPTNSAANSNGVPKGVGVNKPPVLNPGGYPPYLGGPLNGELCLELILKLTISNVDLLFQELPMNCRPPTAVPECTTTCPTR